MTPDGLERSPGAIQFGVPADDPLAVRLFPPLPGTVKWGLDRTERILAALDHPHRAYPVLHVGGTNGKGSVARIWAGILSAAGYRTGLYTSPHLVSFRERIQVDGRPIPDELLEEWSQSMRPLLIRENPSFFEAATALALFAFARSEVDVAVVEVGLGGRLDATNVVSPVLTAITNVSVEHGDLLGGTLANIAREKAGILKPGVPAFTAADDPVALAVLREEAVSRGVLLRRISQPEGRVSLGGSQLGLETARWGPLDLASPMCGRHQIRNIALAVRSLEALPPRLPVSSDAVLEGVRRTRVPGRFQVEAEGERTWVLDVAHNPDGIRALSGTLDELALSRPRVGVVGILADKPWREMLGQLDRVLDVLVLTTPPSVPQERRWDPGAAAASLAPDRTRVATGFEAALKLASSLAEPSGTVVVTGSLHTVGDALTGLGKTPVEALPCPLDLG
ncbi:MAG: bifunctional folylpolyglutamate synthase/dihydrofolate synthase [Gemmatimonadetes bacterium]|nr:bifunctional folylpolyglutamate synthase/dihydrofolate synthase [Gemmatimonadota bacterium]